MYKWLVQIALCLHWFNPLVYWVSRETDRNCDCPVTKPLSSGWMKKANMLMGTCCSAQSGLIKSPLAPPFPLL
ncbi:MAG: hypothetical protein ACLSA6_12145 [Holdemania massiliensis]